MHSLFYILIILGGPRADQNAKHFDYSTASFETQLNAVGFCFFLQMGFQSTRNSQNSSYGHCRNPFPSNVPVEKGDVVKWELCLVFPSITTIIIFGAFGIFSGFFL
jgi:hypothetical protein